jgi:CPSF A subunit region
MSTSAAPTARPVHPCVFQGSTYNRGIEFSTWARLLLDDPSPNLVTAASNSLCIYSIGPPLSNPTLRLRSNHTLPTVLSQVAGAIVFLSTLPSDGRGADALVLGFAGHPRLVVLTIAASGTWQVATLLDFSAALTEHSLGATSVWEQDLKVAAPPTPQQHRGRRPYTLACILGGGVAVAMVTLRWTQNTVVADEPYLLPLASLILPDASTTRDPAQTTTTGFGEMLDLAFLPGYQEPVLVLLHSLHRTLLYCSALSVQPRHGRTALLWSVPVPSDALYLNVTAASFLLVVANNSLTQLQPLDGSVRSCTAVNGWARTPGTSRTVTRNPLVKLSIQLEGSHIFWLDAATALLVLRRGAVYLWQCLQQAWTLLPTGRSFSAAGELSGLTGWSPQPGDALVLAASRLGDSTWLQVQLEHVPLPPELARRLGTPTRAAAHRPAPLSIETNGMNDALEELLRREDAALYGSSRTAGDRPDVVPPSDDDDDDNNNQGRSGGRWTVVRAWNVLDALVQVGPLGPSCAGPIDGRADAAGAGAVVFPSGFGSSGGVALVTVPGRDDRMIVSEEDCLHTDCLFGLPQSGVVLLGMSPKATGGGIRILQWTPNSESDMQLSEVYLEEWCMEAVGVGNSAYADSWEVFQSILLSAGEYADGQRIVLVVKAREALDTTILVAQGSKPVEILRHHRLDLPEQHRDRSTASVVCISSIVATDAQSVAFGCLWSNGDASLVSLNWEGEMMVTWMEGRKEELDVKDEMEMDIDEEAKMVADFYSDASIVTVDVFRAPSRAWKNSATTESVPDVSAARPDVISSVSCEDRLSAIGASLVDMEDEELYAVSEESASSFSSETPSRSFQLPPSNDIGDSNVAIGTYCAICRKNGDLEIYSISELDRVLCSFQGVSLGLPILTAPAVAVASTAVRLPRSHCIAVSEMCFFTCGPTTFHDKDASKLNDLYLSIVTSEGDFSLYVLVEPKVSGSSGLTLKRIPLKSVARPSQEQMRHNAKLTRKGIIAKDNPMNGIPKFVYNTLHRFVNVSGQDGLFAATARPHWLVCERGQITSISHRTRHAAPAGGTPRPVTSFCMTTCVLDRTTTGSGGFVTLHERVGRVGSQRLTVYKGLSNVFHSHGLLPGSGYCMEKFFLGVTVRRILFIEDENVSSSDHPLYALLVSREIELDQSELNTDGLTDLERKVKEEERRTAKISKQVEADLGGFDMESEWVESIERDNCFPIESELGSAPPIYQSIYSLWIVDAANKWMVIDSYELEEYEHAIDLKIMYLTEFQDDVSSSSTFTTVDGETVKDELPKRMFIVLGTGIVNQDGEDVSTKGRVLLFDIKRSKATASPLAELTLAYEKYIFHGPVSTVSCLESESGNNRLVIGAGSDINIEVWSQPHSKLIQVGFYRATMHILDILHFKNFLLLSDAYDSLYFLIWRESDKSLTLLAKDYDPIPVYATGIMSRGAAMTFVCHDDRQNLQFFQYSPGDAAARGGNKLVCRADYHLGKQTTSFRGHYCRPSLLIHTATPASSLSALKQQDALFGRQDDDQRLGVHFSTSDGNIGSIVPLSEPVYWRLMALQSVLANALDSDCALSQRAWRLYRRSMRRGGCRNNDRKKGVIDGDLVLKYADLAIAEQEDLASAIGSTVELILDNLLEVQCGSMIL